MVPAQMESDASGVSGLCGKSGVSQTDSSRNPPLDRLCSRDTVCGGSFKDGTLRTAAVYCRYFPAIYFYVPAYLLLIRYYYRYPQSEWNGTKTGFTVMMIVVGILSEVYLNPGIVRWFVKVLT